MAGIMKFVYALIIFLSFFLLQRTSKVSHFNIYKFPYFVLLYLFACTQYLSLFFFLPQDRYCPRNMCQSPLKDKCYFVQCVCVMDRVA